MASQIGTIFNLEFNQKRKEENHLFEYLEEQREENIDNIEKDKKINECCKSFVVNEDVLSKVFDAYDQVLKSNKPIHNNEHSTENEEAKFDKIALKESIRIICQKEYLKGFNKNNLVKMHEMFSLALNGGNKKKLLLTEGDSDNSEKIDLKEYNNKIEKDKIEFKKDLNKKIEDKFFKENAVDLAEFFKFYEKKKEAVTDEGIVRFFMEAASKRLEKEIASEPSIPEQMYLLYDKTASIFHNLRAALAFTLNGLSLLIKGLKDFMPKIGPVFDILSLTVLTPRLIGNIVRSLYHYYKTGSWDYFNKHKYAMLNDALWILQSAISIALNAFMPGSAEAMKLMVQAAILIGSCILDITMTWKNKKEFNEKIDGEINKAENDLNHANKEIEKREALIKHLDEKIAETKEKINAQDDDSVDKKNLESILKSLELTKQQYEIQIQQHKTRAQRLEYALQKLKEEKAERNRQFNATMIIVGLATITFVPFASMPFFGKAPSAATYFIGAGGLAALVTILASKTVRDKFTNACDYVVERCNGWVGRQNDNMVPEQSLVLQTA